MSRAAHLKKPHRGFFTRRTIRRADAVRIHPPDEFSPVAKTKTSAYFHTLRFFGGRGWIRTTEAESSRFTVCPHWPLGNTPIFSFCNPWIACIYYHPDGSLSTSFAEFLDFCAESKNTKAKAAQKSTFLSGFLELVTGVERATGIALLKNGDFYTKICTFSSLFLVPSCTAHTPTKSKVC